MTKLTPKSWFDSAVIYELIQRFFPKGKAKIRIASGFFTVKGWGLIRGSAEGKQVDLLIGINERNKNRDVREAKRVLIQEIMRELAKGDTPSDRREIVADLVEKIRAGQFRLVDARATKHHAKLYVIDCKIAIVTSANLTGHGLLDQIEAGNFLTQKLEVESLVTKFDQHFSMADDLTQEVLAVFENWLKLANPWDIYLKTLLALEDLDFDNRYKPPTNYQKAMISEALDKIKKHDGVMLIASTGLGKTVVATHVALQLRRVEAIRNALIIGPKLVRKLWETEFLDAGISQVYIGHQALDKEDPSCDWNLDRFLEIENKLSREWLLIMDECHLFRNCHESADGPRRLAFQRLISRIEKSGCKVLLLTGSPYSTDLRNLNHQLLLLPHTRNVEPLASESIQKGLSWRASTIQEFIDLPVVSQLTTPYVAQQYGQEPKHLEGIPIQFGQETRFIPRVMLYRLDFPLFLRGKVEAIIQSRCLNTKESSVIKHQAGIAWISSPEALQYCLHKVINTPGDADLSYDVEFELPQHQRRKMLEPIIAQLKQLDPLNDPKLSVLFRLIERSRAEDKKIIIFSERRATVAYLSKALVLKFPDLRVFSTIQKKEEKYIDKSEREITKAIAKFSPVANSVEKKHEEAYDIFISTDAYGVGINLQDASVVINYDLSWTAIEPIQRAGRVLRPWIEPRTVELYSFFPPIEDATLQELGIAKRPNKLQQRHGESLKILELPVISLQPQEEIILCNLATTVTIQAGELDLEALVSDNISPYYQHASKLHNHRNYARQIGSDIISAKSYPGKRALIYVLFRHQDKYEWAIFDPKLQKIQNLQRDRLLSWLQCESDSERAYVNSDYIEKLSYSCLEAWCTQNGVELDEIIRECAIYLKPERQADDLDNLA